VSGTGFEPGKTYTLNWNTVVGNRMTSRGWEEVARPIAEAKADASGRAEFRFKVPDDLGGVHNLWVDMGNGAKKQGAYWIMPTALPLDLARGPAGTTFRIHLKGVGWSETANIYTVVYDNAISGYACGFNSQGDIEIIMQATGEPGWHYIDLYPAIYKGKEIRPNNFRLPQLTFADAGRTLGLWASPLTVWRPFRPRRARIQGPFDLRPQPALLYEAGRRGGGV
jgi:hypothetical protein